MISFKDIKELIEKSNKIGLTYHVSPDGDALGSLLAFFHALKTLGKDVSIFSKDDLSRSSLGFLPGILNIDGTNSILNNDIDLLIVFDCGNLPRVSCEFNINNVITLGIDHHISNEFYCTYNYVDNESSSTGEIVYGLVKYLGINISKEIALCIYTSIMTDTGGLSFECATQNTFNVIGEIVGTGLDFWNVYQNLFLSQTYAKVKLTGLVFDDLKIIDKKICIMKITEEMIEKSGISEDQTYDIVSKGTTIEGVEVSILIKKTKNRTKVSLRSRNSINVCDIAQKFGGGGHVKASAFVTEFSIEEIEEVLIKEFRKIL